MAKCGYCGSTILIGGLSAGNQRFCNKRCLTNAQVLSLGQRLPANIVDQQVEEVFHGNCPRCRGLGPIDVHKVHRVWSALVLTRWSTAAQLSCRSCATKSQLAGVLFSALLGWWGFPWGLVLTPVQIGRNIAGMWPNRSGGPSPELRKLVLVRLGLQAAQQAKPQSPPPVPA
jgi:hypothetical protein